MHEHKEKIPQQQAQFPVTSSASMTRDRTLWSVANGEKWASDAVMIMMIAGRHVTPVVCWIHQLPVSSPTCQQCKGVTQIILHALHKRKYMNSSWESYTYMHVGQYLYILNIIYMHSHPDTQFGGFISKLKPFK